ncbi:MAG: molecular chaperone DnaK, partial [Deltaproteobacteria bacterium]
IEVTFDIDANGIVHVHAVDKATGKSQQIKITAGSGLSEEEIEKMVRETDEHREEDKKRREVIDKKNELDGLILSTEKMIKEDEGKISDSSKKELEDACTEAKTHLESQSADEIKGALEKLQAVSHKVTTELYQQGGGPDGGDGPGAGAAGEEPKSDKKDDEDVVDADFKEV